MLGRYTGPLILREPEIAHESETIVPRNYLHKLYPQRRNIYGKLVVDHKVTIEQEVAEIRARHELRREYNRVTRAARAARQKANNHVTADHRALDESDA